MFAQPFCLDGQGLYLSSLLLLLEPVHLKHYSGRVNVPKLVLHPLVGFIWEEPESWVLVYDELVRAVSGSLRERWVSLCVKHLSGWEEIPHLLFLCTFVFFLIKEGAELSREMNPVTGL